MAQTRPKAMDQILHELSALFKLCEDTLKQEPLNTDAMFTKAVFLVRAGDYLRAMNYLHMVSDIDPEYPGVWHAKAMVYRSMGRIPMAEHCARLGGDAALRKP